MSKPASHLTLSLCALVMSPLPALPAVSASPEVLLEKAQGLYDGHDSRSRLSFRIAVPGHKTKRLDFLMLWKAYHSGAVEEKTILFQTFPPSRKGIAFMNWIYRDSDHPEEAWLYLPELRSIRKVVHDDHHHHGHKKMGDFSLSLLQRTQLLALDRPLGTDGLSWLPERSYDGKRYLRIERIPHQPMTDMKFARIVDWIDPTTNRIERIEYFDAEQRVVLDERIDWQTIGRANVWRRVSAVDPRTGARTDLEISDTVIDQGLPERYFSKRQMRQGPP